MHGNVWEWCQDDWHKNYENAPGDGSVWIDNDKFPVLRGGSWFNTPNNCRSASRNDFLAHGIYYDYIGFRVACVLPRTGEFRMRECANLEL